MTRKRLKKLIMSYGVQRNDAERMIARASSIGFSNESILNVYRFALVSHMTGRIIVKRMEQFRKCIMEVFSMYHSLYQIQKTTEETTNEKT